MRTSVRLLAVPGLLLVCLLPVARSVPDRGDGEPLAPRQPYAQLECPAEPCPAGTNPSIVLEIVNPLPVDIDVDTDHRLRLDVLMRGLDLDVRHTGLRLAGWITKAWASPLLSSNYLYFRVGRVGAQSRERVVVTDLQLFDPTTLRPGEYRVPYEMWITYKTKFHDVRDSDYRSTSSRGVLKFTVAE